MIILMTVLTFLLAWLGYAAVALVILRNGFTAATGTFMLVLLPVSIAAYAGNVVPLSTLLCSSLLASVLRNTRSWPIVYNEPAICYRALGDNIFGFWS